jgi:hypothetical protein
VAGLYYAVGIGVGGLVSASFVAERRQLDLSWSAEAASGHVALGAAGMAGLVTALLAARRCAIRPAGRATGHAGARRRAAVDGVRFHQLAWRCARSPCRLAAALEPLVLVVYPIAVFVAIFRYHLFDERWCPDLVTPR